MHQDQRCLRLQFPEPIDKDRGFHIIQVLIYQQYVELGFLRNGECFSLAPCRGCSVTFCFQRALQANQHMFVVIND